MQNKDEVFGNLLGYINQISEQWKLVDEANRQALCDAIGDPEIIKRIEKDGMPKMIICGEMYFSDLERAFSVINIPVMKSHYIEDSQCVFSWDEPMRVNKFSHSIEFKVSI